MFRQLFTFQRIAKSAFLFLLVLLIVSSVDYLYPKSKVDVIIDKKFYSELAGMNPVGRQWHLEKLHDKIIMARGFVESFESVERYNRKYRIVVIDNESEIIDVRFYIYTNEEDFREVLQKGDIFEFTGQFVVETPLNSKMDAYIFDVLLEDGALVVQ